MNERIMGLHHVTAITSDPQRNYDFYTGILGLRLVKRTVNFDDPGSYHLYYGDGVGSPGTILTFFSGPSDSRGKLGKGQASAVALAIPRSSIGYWVHRLVERGVSFSGPARRFGEKILTLSDLDGMAIELVAQSDPPESVSWEDGLVPREHAIRGVFGVTILVESLEPTSKLFTDTLGFRLLGREGRFFRFTTEEPGPGGIIDVRAATGFPSGHLASGVIHHLAWRTKDDAEQSTWRDRIESAGISVTPIRDRQYFRSVYFREPGGTLFEIATDSPGFTIDESPEELGRRLCLPPWLEAERERIERALPRMRLDMAGRKMIPLERGAQT